MGSREFNPEDVEWTPEKVIRFWDGLVGRDPESYFSAMHAAGMATWILSNAQFARDKPVLDLGCGGGHLLAELGHRGYRVLGVDSSPQSLRAAASRIGGQNVAEGSVTNIPMASGSAAGVLLVETIEHVLDADLEPMMAEVRRVLATASPLVVTTPNSENLEAAKVTCPDCGARFHPIQHVRSWTADSLTTFLKNSGFSRVRTFETRIAPGTGFRALARRAYYRLRRDRSRLIAVGYV